MKIKKMLSVVCAVLLISSVPVGRAFARGNFVEYPLVPTDKIVTDLPVCDTAKSAYLCDYTSGTIIYSKNENERRPIASMTKIMLLVLAFEKEKAGEFSLDETIKVSANASGMGGSQVFLETNGEYLAGDLIKSIIVSSANDSSVAIAERLFGSEIGAVRAMNEKAEEMGLKNTLSSNCTGLMKPTQYSSAKDVAAMLSALIGYEKYFDYSKIYLDEIQHSNNRKTQMTNTNKLVKYYNGCDGGKTGFTNEAGFCLAATAKRGATRLVSVVIGEADGKKRFADTSGLFDYGFGNYSSKCVLASDKPSDYSVDVKGGKANYVNVVPEKDILVFGLNNTKENVRIVFEPQTVSAPVNIGDGAGKFIVFKDEIKIAEYNAVCFEKIDRMGYIDYIKDITTA